MTPETVYAAIAHGDQDHRAWLLSALRAVWCGEAVPPVASPIADAAAESQPEPVATIKSWTNGSYCRNSAVREPLTDAQIAEMMRDTWGCASIAPRHAEAFARAIEAEVRKDDEALIRQMLEALEYHRAQTRPIDRTDDAITAGRARL